MRLEKRTQLPSSESTLPQSQPKKHPLRSLANRISALFAGFRQNLAKGAAHFRQVFSKRPVVLPPPPTSPLPTAPLVAKIEDPAPTAPMLEELEDNSYDIPSDEELKELPDEKPLALLRRLGEVPGAAYVAGGASAAYLAGCHAAHKVAPFAKMVAWHAGKGAGAEIGRHIAIAAVPVAAAWLKANGIGILASAVVVL